MIHSQEIGPDREEDTGTIRHRIEQELHDGVGQYLTGIRLLSEHLAKCIEEESESRRLVEAILRYSQHASRQLEWIQGTLSSPPPEPETLVDGLEQIASLVNDLPFTECHVQISDSVPEVTSDEIRHHLIRIVQEAVHNAINHGSAARVEIAVGVEGSHLMVSIRDSGSGFDEAAISESGLSNIRERVETIQGDLSIDSVPGNGTVVQCRVELPELTS